MKMVNIFIVIQNIYQSSPSSKPNNHNFNMNKSDLSSVDYDFAKFNEYNYLQMQKMGVTRAFLHDPKTSQYLAISL